jgi:tetratricopeptide (TPR) repeat protein
VKTLAALAMLGACLRAGAADLPKSGLAQADAALQAGEADRALSMLSGMPSSAESHLLRCRVYFSEERWDEAVGECETAVRLEGQNAQNHLWLARALGEKADAVSFVSAFNLAKRARAEFEQAASLDPRSGEALTDLGEFYSSAPGVVGGGNDKAQGLVSQLEKIDLSRAHILQARIAFNAKDYGTAEREFKLATTTSAHPAFPWMALASFYRKRERWNEMQSAVDSGYKAAQHDRAAGAALYNGATVLLKGKRNLALAEKMLEEYLADYSKSEEAPAFQVHTLLARVKAQLGNKDGARQEKAAALSLARDFKPAMGLSF